MHSGFSRLRRCDERIERSLYARATGYSYNAVKIFHTNDCDVSWRLLPTASSSRDVTGSKGPAPPGVGPPGMVDLLAWHPLMRETTPALSSMGEGRYPRTPCLLAPTYTCHHLPRIKTFRSNK